MPTSVFSRLLLPITTASGWRSKLGLAIGTDVQAQDDLLDAIAALSMVADRYIYGTGTDTVALGTITSFARTLLDDATAAAALTTLGVSSGWQTALAQTPTGSYTPTLSTTTNLDSATAFGVYWFRIDSMVTVFGYFEADATASGTTTIMRMSLPVASNFDASRRAGGTFHRQGGIEATGAISAESVNDVAQFTWVAPTTANAGYYFHFSYVVI